MSGVIMSGRRRTLVVLAAVAAVVVAAVAVFVGLRGNGSAVDAGPTVTVSSTPPVVPTQTATPTATVVVPELPDAAKKRTPAGAKAFFNYFIDVYNYSYAVLDTATLQSISDSRCRYCASVVKDVEVSRTKGLKFEDGAVSVAGSIVAPDQSGPSLVMVAFIDQGAGTVYRVDGAVDEQSEAVRNQRVDVTVTWANGAWRMRAVAVTAR